MDKIKLPEPDAELMKRIREVKEESHILEQKATREAPATLEGYQKGLNILRQEAQSLRDKAGHIPELFDKEYKDKLKEIKKVEKLILDKEKEAQTLKDQSFKLKGETLRNLEAECYIPYVIELNQLFWNLQARAFQEDDRGYDKILYEIAQVLDKPPALKYMRVSRRIKNKPGRVLLPSNNYR